MRGLRQWLMLAMVLFSWIGIAYAQETPMPAQTLSSALLTSLSGTRTVSLPHILQDDDYTASGGLVHYQLTINLSEPPRFPLAVFVSKLSLSGKLFLNGLEVGSCEIGPLDHLRCLNQPSLFVPPLSMWRTGLNTLDFEIFANSKQSNGLTPVVVGDAHQISLGPYWNSHLLKNELGEGIAWISLIFGVLSLTVALLMRSRTLYFWFGLTCLCNALVNLTFLLTEPLIPTAVFSWLAFSSRLVSIPLMLLTFLSFFSEVDHLHGFKRLLYAYIVCGPWLIALTDNNRTAVILLYAPLVLIACGLLIAMVRWTWQSRKPLHLITTVMLTSLLLMGLVDWMRLAGRSSFDGVYLLSYGFSGLIFMIGGMMLSLIANALNTSRELSAILEQQVANRTAQLQVALDHIERMEQTTLRLTENIPVGTYIMETSPEGVPRFTFLSERWLKMLNLNREYVLEDPVNAFRAVHPDDYDAFLALNKEVFAQMKAFQWEGRVVVNNQIRWLNVESVPRRLRNGGAVWEGVMVDVTAYKQAEEELKQAYQTITQAEIERSKQEERERMLQDMHDGFGSHLSSARIMAEQGNMTQVQLTQVLQECMSDLYLIVDTLRQPDLTLDDALVDFRYRIDRRLLDAPIQIQWAIQIAHLPPLQQRIILQVLRILQEALNNAFKHASANNIWITLHFDCEHHCLRMEVLDDGRGLPVPLIHGRGFHNMQRRAREIKAELAIASAQTGTQISLKLDCFS